MFTAILLIPTLQLWVATHKEVSTHSIIQVAHVGLKLNLATSPFTAALLSWHSVGQLKGLLTGLL